MNKSLYADPVSCFFSDITKVMLLVCRRIRALERNESLMYLCVKKIAMAGGKTARMNSPARVTGTKDGTGLQACTKAHIYLC